MAALPVSWLATLYAALVFASLSRALAWRGGKVCRLMARMADVSLLVFSIYSAYIAASVLVWGDGV